MVGAEQKVLKNNMMILSNLRNSKNGIILFFVIDLPLALFATFLFMRFVCLNSVVVSGSMESTLMTGDRAIFRRIYNYHPNRGDIILFSENRNKFTGTSNDPLCKRVIGLPGDVIYFSDGYLYINDEKQDEEYVNEKGTTNYLTGNDGFVYVVPEGKIFVMGDNRLYSSDSRAWDDPYVDIDCVFGKYMFTYFHASMLAPFIRNGGFNLSIDTGEIM